MKLRKIIYSAGALGLSMLMLSACSTTAKDSSSSSSSSAKSSQTVKKTQKPGKKIAGASLKDGTYKLVEDSYDHGYKVEMEMTVKNGKIKNTKYDQVNKDGKSKAKDSSYEKQMKKYAKIGPKEYISQINQEWASNASADNPGNLSAISGATNSSYTASNYAGQLTQAAQAGDTKTIHIANKAKYHDGTYKLEEKNYSHGYRQVYTLVIKDHKIDKLTYDQVDKNGKSKTKDAKYEKQMKKYAKVGPKEYIPKLMEEFAKSNGNMEKVQVVSGATESSNQFIAYVGQLLNAAQEGNARSIHVDNIVYKD